MMQSKSEIIEGLTAKWSEITEVIEAVSEDEFTSKSNPNVWSLAEEFDHVLKSASAVSSAMKVSSIALRWKFGKPNRPLRSYEECYQRYFEKLKLVSGKPIAPSTFTSSDGQFFDKQQMLDHWISTLTKLDQRINKWTDKNLDRVLLPHPLLGKMMLREILYFTHFHTEHHLQSLQKKASVL
jgi:hypothetical protein